MSKSARILCVIAVALTVLSFSSISHGEGSKLSQEQIKFLTAKISLSAQVREIKARYPDAIGAESGLHYIVTREGEGEATPQKGNTVSAHYEGKLLNGRVFDSSYKKGRPLQFPVGMRYVIPGWDEAFLTMKKGEKRTLIIPSKLGYGARGSGSIPAHSILVFEAELLDWTE